MVISVARWWHRRLDWELSTARKGKERRISSSKTQANGWVRDCNIMAASLSTALKEQLSCSVCMSVYTQPKTLTCLHSFCLPCLKQLARKTPPDVPLRCPDCKADINLAPGHTVDSLPNSFYFDRLLELLAYQKPEQASKDCGNCKDDAPLTNFCFDCAQHLCYECVDAHRWSRVFKSHKLVSLQDEVDERHTVERQDRCGIERHGKERLQYFCEDCTAHICRKCVVFEHSQHRYAHVTEAVARCKTAMKEAGNRVKTKTAVIRDALTVVESNYGLIRKRLEDATRDLDKRVEDYVQSLKDHKKFMLWELQSIQQDESRRYEEQRGKLEVRLEQLDSAVNFVDAVIERNLAREIISTHDSVIKRCTELTAGNEPPTVGREVDVSYEAFKHFTVESNGKFTPGRLVHTGIADPSLSTVDPRSLKAVAGKLSEILLTARDSQGRICSHGGDNVDASMFGDHEYTDCTVLDHKNGLYTIRFTPRNVSICSIRVNICKRKVAGSPFWVRVQNEFSWTKWPGPESSRGQRLRCPWGIAVNSRGEVAVSEKHCVLLFTGAGKHLKTVGRYGAARGQFKTPAGIAFDSEDRMIVADSDNHRIQIWSCSQGVQDVKTFGEGELVNPGGVCTTTDGYIAVTSRGQKQGVKVYTRDGVLDRYFDDPKRRYPPYAITHGSGQFLVSYPDDNAVSVFSNTGTLLFSLGDSDERFNWPLGLAMDNSKRILVCDHQRCRILLFSKDGKFLHETSGTEEGPAAESLGYWPRTDERKPVAIALSPGGHIYVSAVDGDGSHIFALDPNVCHGRTFGSGFRGTSV